MVDASGLSSELPTQHFPLCNMPKHRRLITIKIKVQREDFSMFNKVKLLCILLLLPSYASAIEVAFLNPGKQGERFWDMVTETMQAAASDFDLQLEVVYAERNRVKMVELGQQLTSRSNPPDYLILVNEEQAAEKILKSTEGTQIKTLMLLNDFLPHQKDNVGQPGDNPNLLGSVVPDNTSAGNRMMSAILKCAEDSQDTKPYHILAVGGDKLTPASIDRNSGALQVIEQNTEQFILDRFLYANWNQTEAENITTNYLNWAKRNQIKPSGIWAANDPIAAGAKAALVKAGLKPGVDTCLVGLNWSTQGLEMVKSGEMILTDGGHFLAGAWSIILLNDYHTRKAQGDATVPGRVNFQMQSIDKTNIDQYLTYLGDENWDKINFSGFSLGKDAGYSDYNFSLRNVFKNISQ